MAITTNVELISAVGNWLHRSNLNTRIPEFITLSEARIYYGMEESPDMPFPSPPLRIRIMEQTEDFTVNSEEEALPSLFLEPRRMFFSGDPKRVVKYVTPDQLRTMWAGSETGKPEVFTIEGSNFVFGPVPDATYTLKLLSYKRFNPLGTSNPTNSLLTNHPNVYLYAVLLEAMPFLNKNDSQLARWYSMFRAATGGLQSSDHLAKHAGSALQIRTDAGAP